MKIRAINLILLNYSIVNVLCSYEPEAHSWNSLEEAMGSGRNEAGQSNPYNSKDYRLKYIESRVRFDEEEHKPHVLDCLLAGITIKEDPMEANKLSGFTHPMQDFLNLKNGNVITSLNIGSDFSEIMRSVLQSIVEYSIHTTPLLGFIPKSILEVKSKSNKEIKQIIKLSEGIKFLEGRNIFSLHMTKKKVLKIEEKNQITSLRVLDDKEICSICRDLFKKPIYNKDESTKEKGWIFDQVAMFGSCGHCFHDQCLRDNFINKRPDRKLCPLCRAQFIPWKPTELIQTQTHFSLKERANLLKDFLSAIDVVRGEKGHTVFLDQFATSRLSSYGPYVQARLERGEKFSDVMVLALNSLFRSGTWEADHITHI